MRVVIKNPNEAMKITDVENLKEINKLVGNVDENGEGLAVTNGNICQEVFDGIGIEMYVNENSNMSLSLKRNFWDVKGNVLYGGTVNLPAIKQGLTEYVR